MMQEMNDMTPINWEQKSNLIKIFGVGGCGGNAVNMMYGKDFTDIDFVISNTDLHTLRRSPVNNKLQLGKNTTKGLGAGCNPIVGRNAALESRDEIVNELSNGTELLFLVAGMGGGTGTGASPVIAQIAQELGILTIAVVTRPFKDELYEAEKRAYDGIIELSKHVDSLLIIDNDKIYEICEGLKVKDAFEKVNEVICTAVKGIVEIVTGGGHVQVDLADLTMVMKNSGMSYMGMGQGKGKDRALEAIQNALKSPLLHECDITTAKSALINITSHTNNSIDTNELRTIMNYINNATGRAINFKRGLVFSDDIDEDTINVTVVATGFRMRITPPRQEDKKEYYDERTITLQDGDNYAESSENWSLIKNIDENLLFSDIDLDSITTYSRESDIAHLERESALKRLERIKKSKQE